MQRKPNLCRALAEILLTRRIIVIEPGEPVPSRMALDRYIAAKNPPAIVRATEIDAAALAAEIQQRN